MEAEYEIAIEFMKKNVKLLIFKMNIFPVIIPANSIVPARTLLSQPFALLLHTDKPGVFSTV